MDTNVNGHLKRALPGERITATLITDGHARMACLPRIAGMRCVQLENTIYSMLSRLCGDYEGGYWHFYALSNDGFYMAPAIDGRLHLSGENYFEGDVSADSAGLIACAMAYSNLSFMNNGQCFATAYSRLSDFIYQHGDAAVIRAALD